jgi:hypothetical protein
MQNLQFPVGGWAALVTFASLISLFGSWWAAFCAGVFVLGSIVLNQGARWTSRGAVAVAILALAVTFGFPHPDQWREIAKTIPPLMTTALAK